MKPFSSTDRVIDIVIDIAYNKYTYNVFKYLKKSRSLALQSRVYLIFESSHRQ